MIKINLRPEAWSPLVWA